MWIWCVRQLSLQPELSSPFEAVEFRLLALDTGTVRHIGFKGFEWPSHPFEDNQDYRIESAYQSGSQISGIYDGLCARFIVRARRGNGIKKLRSWLETFEIEGVKTNLSALNMCED